MSQPTMYERGIGDSLPDRGRETGVAPGLAGAGHPCMHAQYMHAQYIHSHACEIPLLGMLSYALVWFRMRQHDSVCFSMR